jgi:hypothetical protein
MNTIAGRAGAACVDAGVPGCREHAPTQSATAITKAAIPFTSEICKRINLPRAKIILEAQPKAVQPPSPRELCSGHLQMGAGFVQPNLVAASIAFFYQSLSIFQHLDLRSVIGGGGGIHVIKTTNTTFDVFAGGNYDKEDFSPNPPLVPTSVTRNVAEVLAGEELSWKLNNRVSFDERFTAFPNVSDLGQYRLQFDPTGATKLKAWLSWQVTVSDRYLSNPLPGLKSNDELLSTGLRLTFCKGTF